MNTRTALLNSAEKAVRQRGYDAFSFADLARDVGIRKASIHHHFPTKADLALDLIARYATEFTKSLAEIDTKSETAAAKLQAYHAIYRDALMGGTQVCLCVAMSAGRDSFREPVLEQLSQFQSDSIAWLTQVFETARQDETVPGLTDPEAEAFAAFALMEGAQLLARAGQDVTLFDQATAAFLSRLSPRQH